MQIRQNPLKGLWLLLSFLLLLWFSVIISSASPRYCLCQLCSQLGTVPRYLVWQCLSVRMVGMGNDVQPQSCMALLHILVRWGRQSLALPLSEIQTLLCNHIPRSRVAAAGVAPSFRKHVFPTLPLVGIWAKLGFVLANGNALSEASALCLSATRSWFIPQPKNWSSCSDPVKDEVAKHSQLQQKQGITPAWRLNAAGNFL